MVSYDIYDFEITTHCQAGCPACPRFDITYDIDGKIIPTYNLSLKPKHMEFNDFKEVVLKNDNIWENKQINFCGEFGDPMIHPNVEKFIDIINSSSAKELIINTNGGIRKPEFYKHLCTNYEKLSFIFGIDGLTNKTNQLYRRRVNTKIAFENLTVVASFGKATWKYIIFDHNYFEIDDVEKFSKKFNIPIIFIINTREYNRISKINLEKIKKYNIKGKKWEFFQPPIKNGN